MPPPEISARTHVDGQRRAKQNCACPTRHREINGLGGCTNNEQHPIQQGLDERGNPRPLDLPSGADSIDALSMRQKPLPNGVEAVLDGAQLLLGSDGIGLQLGRQRPEVAGDIEGSNGLESDLAPDDGNIAVGRGPNRRNRLRLGVEGLVSPRHAPWRIRRPTLRAGPWPQKRPQQTLPARAPCAQGAAASSSAAAAAGSGASAGGVSVGTGAAFATSQAEGAGASAGPAEGQGGTRGW